MDFLQPFCWNYQHRQHHDHLNPINDPQELPPHFPYTGEVLVERNRLKDLDLHWFLCEGIIHHVPHDLFKVPLLRLGIQDVDGPSKYLKFFCNRYFFLHVFTRASRSIVAFLLLRFLASVDRNRPTLEMSHDRDHQPFCCTWSAVLTTASGQTKIEQATTGQFFKRNVSILSSEFRKIHAMYILGVPPSQ